MWHSADSANHALENSRKNLQILSNQPEVEWQTVAYAKSFPPSTGKFHFYCFNFFQTFQINIFVTHISTHLNEKSQFEVRSNTWL